MNLEAFRRTLQHDKAPDGLSQPLQALWHLGRDEWDRAHEIIQAQNDPDSSWIHAHLHRVEGDLSNARYWYTRAGRAVSKSDLESEWEEIAKALLAKGD